MGISGHQAICGTRGHYSHVMVGQERWPRIERKGCKDIKFTNMITERGGEYMKISSFFFSAMMVKLETKIILRS